MSEAIDLSGNAIEIFAEGSQRDGCVVLSGNYAYLFSSYKTHGLQGDVFVLNGPGDAWLKNGEPFDGPIKCTELQIGRAHV